MEKPNLTDKEKYDLKKLYEMNPDFYKRSEADRKKYGEERLMRMNAETLEKIRENNRKAHENRKVKLEEIAEYIREESKNIVKGRKYFIL